MPFFLCWIQSDSRFFLKFSSSVFQIIVFVFIFSQILIVLFRSPFLLQSSLSLFQIWQDCCLIISRVDTYTDLRILHWRYFRCRVKAIKGYLVYHLWRDWAEAPNLYTSDSVVLRRLNSEDLHSLLLYIQGQHEGTVLRDSVWHLVVVE